MAYPLERFVRAQDAGGTYSQALSEIRHGRKTSHWMWFVFPQVVGLGHSAMAERYGITSLEEAQAYLAHPVLGPRLLEAAGAVVELSRRADAAGEAPPTAERIFGGIDSMKLRSSMTLFGLASGPGSIFQRVLDAYFDGRNDPATVSRI